MDDILPLLNLRSDVGEALQKYLPQYYELEKKYFNDGQSPEHTEDYCQGYFDGILILVVHLTRIDKALREIMPDPPELNEPHLRIVVNNDQKKQ